MKSVHGELLGRTCVPALLLLLLISATASAGPGEPAQAAASAAAYDPAILDEAGRTEDDHYRDEGFKPLDVYSFFGIEPGMTVADLSTSRMYNAHILAQIVGETGKVYAVLGLGDTVREGAAERAQTTYEARNVAGGLANVEIVNTLEDLPENSLDALITVRNYHDFGERAERMANLPRLLRVLKPGGVLGAVDAHTDKTGERDESVHRMNENLAREEIVEGGFEFVGNSEVLYNAEDTFDFDGRRDGDPIHRYFIQRWVLKFQRPVG